MTLPIYAIYAINEEHGMGLKGKLPWHVPEELAWYKTQTTGCVLICSRETYRHLPAAAKEDRYHILVSRRVSNPRFYEGYAYARSIEEAVKLAQVAAKARDAPAIYVIGGPTILQLAMRANLIDLAFESVITPNRKCCDRYLDVGARNASLKHILSTMTPWGIIYLYRRRSP